MQANTPTQEADRLEALRQYKVLDTPAERSYDDITSLAAFICDVPIALISLVDAERQWFKSKVGLVAQETSRDVSFCAHAILSPAIMVVNDAAGDERFASNPLVTGELGIRFYAGVPLISPGSQALGTLCVIDKKPRTLDVRQIKALEALSRQVVTQLELRRVSSQLAEALEKMELMAGLVPICSYCKGIRNDQGYWSTVESFIQQYSDVGFTHGVCDHCMKRHFPEVAEILLPNLESKDITLED
ncbi:MULTISPECIES: GAF domain-containing protein [Cyanophyceae]|uniref:GAF domain-containing protein n=1 Tax=Cyanophyceae TaxID=3028117 RepID=UPI001685EB7B|nr:MULTISPECIES: GAF domain-containing protein [Cyanophyceae]MBD1916223.1 GAF domain-containing protein [Phormidium sp. FACHB-77]MBD2031508.1 GAF domain-containing protein [Phormidium sp. FACHB-322]MBD2052865.1 GAF domain-containing protein [Leptolyngbya sp. FACHB-60]